MLLIANQPLASDALYQLRFSLTDANGTCYALERRRARALVGPGGGPRPGLDRPALHRHRRAGPAVPAFLGQRAWQRTRLSASFRASTIQGSLAGMRQNCPAANNREAPAMSFFSSRHLYPAHLSTIKSRVDDALSQGRLRSPAGRGGHREDALPRRHAVSVQGQPAVQAVAAPDPASALLDRLYARHEAGAGLLPAGRLLARAAQRAGRRMGRAFRYPRDRRTGRGRASTFRRAADPAIIGEADAALPGFAPNNPKAGARLPALPSRLQDAL